MKNLMNHLLSKILVGAALVGATGSPAFGQSGTPGFIASSDRDANPFGVQAQQLNYVSKDGTPNQPGKPFSEVLRGNGTRAGYVLSNGGIIPNTVSVTVGAKSLRANRDYYLDAANGSLFFAEPVRRTDSIRVSYRYVEGQNGSRSPMALPGLSLNLRGGSLNFAYGVSSAGPNGLDFTTYGLNLNSKSGGVSLNGMFYFSNPAESNNNRVTDTPNGAAPNNRAAAAQQAKSDRLIVQDVNVQSGKASFRASFQDIGEQFNGFQAMRQSNAGNADAMNKINALERERGVQRLGFGMGLQTGKASSFGIDWDRIGDGKGSIERQSFNYASQGFNLRYSAQSVSEQFARFQGLREAEAGQWAQERGIQRSSLTLGFATGKDSQMGFSQSSFGDRSGSLNRQSFNLTGKNFNFQMSNRKATEGFNRLNNLSGAEKAELALDIRRQFNPSAAAGEVNGKDIEQIAREAGLERSRMSFGANLGKQSVLGFNQFSVSDGKGSIQRSMFNLTSKNLTFSYMDQNISEEFNRLGSLSDFERSQFNNERGIRRTAMNLNLNLNKISTFAFSQLNLSDREGGLLRQNFAYNTKGLEARLNIASTDKSFNRVRDLAGLSDAERQAMEAERGYDRTDFTARLTSVKNLTVDTFLSNSRNSADRLGRDLFRHNLNWTNGKNTRINFLTEGAAFTQDDKTMEGRNHDLITLDHDLGKGMKLNMFRDTLTTTTGGKQLPTVTTNYLQFQTDRSKANNLLAELRRIDMGDGKFENTTHLDLNHRLSKSLSVRFNHLDVDRGKDPSAQTNLLQWNWQISKTLNFTGTYGETKTNNNADVKIQSYALSGALTDNLNFAASYSEINSINRNLRAQQELSLSNARPMNLLGLKDVVFGVKYAGLRDQGRLMTENVSGRMQAMLGKNQMVVEYGGMLDQKGNNNLARTLSFISDRNEKLPLHFDITYTTRNINHSDTMLERRYNMSLRLDALTKLAYTYNSLPLNVNQQGQLMPITNSAFSLKRILSKNMNFSLDYATNYNHAAKVRNNNLSALFSGRLDSLTAVQVGYSVDLSNVNGQNTNAHTVRLSYDRQVNGDNFVVVSTAYTMNRNGQGNNVQANLDYKRRF